MLGAVALYVVLSAANLYWGDLNQDEGWYLYSARQVAEGKVPYRDFAFTQAPVLPFVYASALSWVERWGIAGGRLFTVVLGLAGILLASALAARLAAPDRRGLSAALAFMLISGNVYQSYFTTVVKTYSLCALFLVVGLYLLSWVKANRDWPAALVAGALLALAAGTRISAGGAAVVAFFYLLLHARRMGWGPLAALCGGGGLTALAVFLPLYLAAPEGFLFGVVQYHSGRSAGSVLQGLVFKAGFISRLVQAYYLPLMIAFVMGVGRILRLDLFRSDGEERTCAPFQRALLGVIGLITLIHFTAPVPYDDYQVMLYPLFCAVLAGWMATWLGGARRTWSAWVLAALLFAQAFSAFSSPINQSWFIIGRDRIWWRMKEQPDLQRLREVALWINRYATPGEVLLTQDTYLAVEAGLSVPPGMEMGPFSYYPALSRQEAEILRVLNRERLEDILKTTPARMAAFSGYGLAIASPEVQPISEEEYADFWTLVYDRYTDVLEVPDFGQAHTLLKVLMAASELEDFEAP